MYTYDVLILYLDSKIKLYVYIIIMSMSLMFKSISPRVLQINQVYFITTSFNLEFIIGL